MGFSFDSKYKILFDNGYESVHNLAFPLMQKYGSIGLVFPVANYIEKINGFDFERVKESIIHKCSVLTALVKETL